MNSSVAYLAYNDFKQKFKSYIVQHPDIITRVMSNIFSMRIIGNKTHGDLAEIAISEFINQYLPEFESKHVGKDLFRSKSHEEDIVVKSISGEYKDISIPISLKAYGDGPLQLSTDKEQVFFSYLSSSKGKEITDKNEIHNILYSKEFQSIFGINVMPLIYDEAHKKCNIMVFDFTKAYENTDKILYIDKNQRFDEYTKQVVYGKGREHPIYLFVDKYGHYICEVRYGGKSANALQRGFWTHTKNAVTYFDSLTNGWINYSINNTLVKLFALALNAYPEGHDLTVQLLQQNINKTKERNAR